MNKSGDTLFWFDVYISSVKLVEQQPQSNCCRYCNKYFPTMHNLQRHERIYTGEKPYSCELYTMKFRDLSSGRRHYQVYTRDKPYICEICQKRFTRKHTLRRHQTFTHSDLFQDNDHTNQWALVITIRIVKWQYVLMTVIHQDIVNYFEVLNVKR